MNTLCRFRTNFQRIVRYVHFSRFECLYNYNHATLYHLTLLICFKKTMAYELFLIDQAGSTQYGNCRVLQGWLLQIQETAGRP